MLAHSGLCDSSSAKDVHRGVGDLGGGFGGLHLEESDLSGVEYWSLCQEDSHGEMRLTRQDTWIAPCSSDANHVSFAMDVDSPSTHHVAHLEGNGLEPSLERFDLGNHVGKLVPDDWLRCEWFAKGLSLARPSVRAGQCMVICRLFGILGTHLRHSSTIPREARILEQHITHLQEH